MYSVHGAIIRLAGPNRRLWSLLAYDAGCPRKASRDFASSSGGLNQAWLRPFPSIARDYDYREPGSVGLTQIKAVARRRSSAAATAFSERRTDLDGGRSAVYFHMTRLMAEHIEFLRRQNASSEPRACRRIRVCTNAAAFKANHACHSPGIGEEVQRPAIFRAGK